MKLEEFTVLLMYPDDIETYQAHVKAQNVTRAVALAKIDAREESSGSFELDEFTPLAIYRGFLENMLGLQK